MPGVAQYGGSNRNLGNAQIYTFFWGGWGFPYLEKSIKSLHKSQYLNPMFRYLIARFRHRQDIEVAMWLNMAEARQSVHPVGVKHNIANFVIVVSFILISITGYSNLRVLWHTLFDMMKCKWFSFIHSIPTYLAHILSDLTPGKGESYHSSSLGITHNTNWRRHLTSLLLQVAVQREFFLHKHCPF